MLSEEVKPDSSTARHSQTTGHLLVTMPKVLSHAFCQYVTVIVTSKYQVTINHKFIKVHFRPGIMDCILTWRSLCVGYWPLSTCFRSTQWWRQLQAMTQRKMGTRRMTVSLQGRGNPTAVCLLFVTLVLFFLLVSLYRGEVYLPSQLSSSYLLQPS